MKEGGQVLASLESSVEKVTVAVNRARAELTNKRLAELEFQRAAAELGVYVAKVTIVDRVVDAASGTFGVRLGLPNIGYRLPAGVKCKVRLLRK